MDQAPRRVRWKFRRPLRGDLPHFLLLGTEREVDDILTAIEKVVTKLDKLTTLDAGVKAASRTGRSNLQKDRQW